MIKYRALRLIGLLLLVLWAAGVVVVLSALAGIEAAEHGRPGPAWVTPAPHPRPSR